MRTIRTIVRQPRSFIVFRLLVPGCEALIRRLDRRASMTFFSTGEFPWVSEIEGDWPAIRREVDELLRAKREIPNFQELSKDQEKITDDDKWKTFVFHVFGTPIDRNCRRCPATARALQKIPGVRSAMFSILDGDKHIPPHRGPYKGVLRYHLGIRIPDPAGQCRIRVSDDVRHWANGRSLIFDDSFEHEAWNDSPEERVVLFVDFLRPLPFPLDRINDLVVRGIARTNFARKPIEKLAC